MGFIMCHRDIVTYEKTEKMTMKMKKENENHRLLLVVLLAASVIMLIAPVYATDVCDLATGQTVYTGQVITCDSVREFYWCTDSVGHNGISTATTSTTWTDFPYPTNPTAWRYHTRLDGGYAVKNWWYWADGPYPTSTNVTFSISNSTNFAQKLMGVNIVLSGGQTGITNVSGMATIKITPNSSSTLTYSLTKTGFITQTSIPLSGYGLTGGLLYTTMTPDDGTIPPGQVRTYFQNVDISGSHVQDSNIFIRDLTANLWHNWSADFDGTGYIDSLSTSRLSGYGTATGYDPASRINVTPGDFVYELIMVPTGLLLAPGTNNVNLIAIVNDRGTGAPISGASISTTIPSGAYTGTSTSSSGTADFIVPNMSVIHISVSKTGYLSASKVITTTAFGPDTVRIEMDKAVVTATVTQTPQPGELTPRPTYIAGCEPGGDPVTCAANQDANLWVQMREQSGLIMSLALLAVIIGLVKIMGK